MKNNIIYCFIFTCITMHAQQAIPLKSLEGQWHIIMTDFPMWTKGHKTAPTFNYSVTTTKGGDTVLLDEVKYLKKGKEKSIVGVDYRAKDHHAFVWRGKGLLFLLKSRWEILYLNPDHAWMLIHFQKTLFTPEGYDVVARVKNLPDQEIKAINEKLKALHITSELTLLK